MKGESIKVVDGGNQSVFSRNNLPIHHLVVEGHHGKIQIGEQAGKLFPGGLESSSKNLGRTQIKFFDLILKFFNLFLQPLVLAASALQLAS